MRRGRSPGSGQATAPVEALRRTLERGGAAVELRETHASWVLLSGDRAYKVKKPVSFPFMDLSAPDDRRRACEAEVAVNEPLGGDLMLGVRAIVVRDGAAALVDPGHPEASDHVVVMRRYDEACTMASLLASGRLTRDDAAAVGGRIASFHRHAPVRPGADPVAAVRANARELSELGTGTPMADRLHAAERSVERFAAAWQQALAARAAVGCVVDGHGDIRAEHVVLRTGAPLIVDRLEFDERLRQVDVADDLSFLAMDLERLGARWAADAVVEGYRAASGPAVPDRLLAFFGAHRARVRAKVALLREAQLQGPGTAATTAGELLGLAERLTWRARGPLIVVVCGPPGSGKSTVAAALAALSGLPVLSSDRIRKELLGAPPTSPLPSDDYAPDRRAEVYGQLGRRAEAAGAALVDATFGHPALRAAFLSQLGPAGRRRLRVVECRAPDEVLLRRVRERPVAAAHGSDADVRVAEALRREFTSFDEVGPAERLAVQTTAPVDAVVEQVEEWLDGRLDGRLEADGG